MGSASKLKHGVLAVTGLAIVVLPLLNGCSSTGKPSGMNIQAATGLSGMIDPDSGDAAWSQPGFALSSSDKAPQLDLMTTGSISTGVFGSVTIPMRNFPVAARWAPVFQDVRKCAGSPDCIRANPAFEETVEKARSLPFSGKLATINTNINAQIAYRQDSKTYGKLDYWAMPSEILRRGSGDCEDFAILKMTALLSVGIPAESMSLVVLQDTQKNVYHAVLAVTTQSGIFVLDNTKINVMRDVNLTSYVPLYSLSSNRAWIHGSRSRGVQTAGATLQTSDIAPGEGPGFTDIPVAPTYKFDRKTTLGHNAF
jgi:predicted transglutaminase-like cysteine proteinase